MKSGMLVNLFSSKIQVEIIVPAGKCTCTYSKWIENIWDKLDKFREYVDVETTDTNSQRAKDLGVSGQSLIVNGQKIPVFKLQTKLGELMKKSDI
ncbi:MAG: hypothetical protein ACW981_07195 [Candidatus Hodarchaeales archaeon]